MKKKLALILMIFVGIFLVANISHAAWDYGISIVAKGGGYKTSGPQSELTGIVASGISIFLSLLAILFLAIMFYAGLRWMTARGNEEHIQSAKNALIAGSIGFGIVVSSYAISLLVFSQLAPSNTSTSTSSNSSYTQDSLGCCVLTNTSIFNANLKLDLSKSSDQKKFKNSTLSCTPKTKLKDCNGSPSQTAGWTPNCPAKFDPKKFLSGC